MNRRELLKNLGMGAGALVIGPTVMSLLQSCGKDNEQDWEPVFLNSANGFALENILEVIIPKSSTPGATDLNIAQFIDSYMKEVASLEDQEDFKRSSNAFAVVFKNETSKKVEEGTPEEYEMVVGKYLKSTPSLRKDYLQRITETQDPMDKMPDEEFNFAEGSFSYLRNLRNLGIWAWKTSEEIGENVLWYDPIPGIYIPCAPVEELGNGKAMSL